MKETRLYIGKMDCATEEQIINNRLGRIKEVDKLEFDLMNRVRTVFALQLLGLRSFFRSDLSSPLILL